MGAGGIGGYIGAKLYKGGHDVTFVARGQHLQALKQKGLQLVSPEGNVTVKTTFTDSLFRHPQVDLIIISVKSFDTLSAIETLRPVVASDTIILSMQNGIENEELLSNSFGSNRVLAGVAYIFSIITEPGIISHIGGAGKFKFGEINGKISDRTNKLETIFQNSGINAQASDQIFKSLWEKWFFICGLGGMTAYTKKTIGEILSDNNLLKMLEEVILEAVKIGRKQEIGQFINAEEKVLAHCQRLHPSSTSSMYHDATTGKRVEVEALNGAVVRFGNKLGIATPANSLIYDRLKIFS
jgi:2-dehydropantoate 2-reductase